MDEKMVRYLQKVPLLQAVPEPLLYELAQRTVWREMVKDEPLVRQGEPSEAVYIVRLGWLQVVAENEQGEPILLAQCGPGELIGEMSLLNPQPCPATVVALSPAQLIELRRDSFEALAAQRPSLALHVAQALAMQMDTAVAYLQRAIDWNLDLAEKLYNPTIAAIEGLQASGASPLYDELLSSYFELAQSVKLADEQSRPKGQTPSGVHFSIEIDEARRQAEVEKLAQRTFFGRLQTASRQMRQRRGEE